MKEEIKAFNIFCRNDEEGNPVFHKITISSKGAIRLHDHPEVKSELFYHLLMVQKLKGEEHKRPYWQRRTEYKCSGCLQFYFSLVHRKFEEHIRDIEFKTEGAEENIAYKKADNDRIEHYLEKVRNKTRKREPFDRELVWSEKAFYAYNVRYWQSKRENIFKNLFFKGIEQIDRYDTSLYVQFKSELSEELKASNNYTATDNYCFLSNMSQRCSTSHHGRRQHDGYMSVNLVLTKTWWTNVRNKGLAHIESPTHGRFFVLQAIPQPFGYLVDAIVVASGTKKKYEVKTFYVAKNQEDGSWIVRRKNGKRTKAVNE